MPDLILLCAGAAIDPAPAGGSDGDALSQDAFAAEARELVRGRRHGAFARRFAAARVLHDDSDEAPLPRELPEERWLRGLFGVPEADSVSAWAAAAFGLAVPRWRATPVHVEVGRYQIVLADPRALRLDAEQAAALADAARPLLQAEGFALELGSPQDWFLAGNADWALDAHAWNMAVGRSIDGHLPAGGQARRWRRLFTELQMAWHDHPANQAREALRLPPVNALWLDGCARGPLAARPLTAFTDDEAIAGLALAAGGRRHPAAQALADPAAALAAFLDGTATSSHAPTRPAAAAPASASGAAPRSQATAPLQTTASSQAAASSTGADPAGDLLIDLGLWRPARLRGNPAAWREAWTRFDDWLSALPGRGTPPPGFERLRLVAGGERRCVELALRRHDRLRFWRRLDAARTLLMPAAPEK